MKKTNPLNERCLQVDLYTFIHKAQNFHMINLSEEIGKSDFTVRTDANKVAQKVLPLIGHLKDHAQRETGQQFL